MPSSRMRQREPMADVQVMKTAAELRLAEAFAAAKGSLPGDAEVAAQRADAFRRFDSLGLPHRRVEELSLIHI